MITRRGLFLGRFQPFHNGHLAVVENMIADKDIDEIIIGIGSAQSAYTLDNPFTAGERFEMINNTLRQQRWYNEKPIYIMPIMDIGSNYKYMSYLQTILPQFHVYYGSNDLMHVLCENAGIESVSVSFDDTCQRSGTWIRANIKSNLLDWRDYVPEAVVKYIVASARLFQWTENDICNK
jgi:nicotinamide-nucleotide adenylyltransferase